MSVGFNHIITFDKCGKISDYQKAYNNDYAKTVKIFLPLYISNKNFYNCYLYVSINNTFPKEIIKVCGDKSNTDLNCYIFDLSEIYRQFEPFKKIGLSQIVLMENNKYIFKSETFRI